MGAVLKVKSLKLAESIRVRFADEDKFLDFSSAKYKDFEAYYKDGLIYIINKHTGECNCTSSANIRQMAVYDLFNSGDFERTPQADSSQADAQSQVGEIRKAKRSNKRSIEAESI